MFPSGVTTTELTMAPCFRSESSSRPVRTSHSRIELSADAAKRTLPPGWKFATALSRSTDAGGALEFVPVTLETLVDSPLIAGAHHEKLDGTGYPKQLRGESIPPAARMMAITDIYDALTAKDRPYKKAIPPEKALDILSGDVKRGQLDGELFDIFIGSRVWALTMREDK